MGDGVIRTLMGKVGRVCSVVSAYCYWVQR